MRLKNEKYLMIDDQYYGCDQEWYKKKWRRKAGCGATSAANLILYNRKENTFSQETALKVMDQLWTDITPTIMGVNKSSIFVSGMRNYLKKNQLNFDVIELYFPKNKEARMSYDLLEQFILEALQEDQPISFLNLSNGNQPNLDSWHWTTLTGYEEESKIAMISDGGMCKEINLKSWYKTTKASGGFAYLKSR